MRLMKEVEEEVTSLLSGLIRINTTNPPGNETEAAKYVAKTLEKDGFKCELFESAPGRGSVITRLKGSGEKPSLLLLSHLDVVAANPKEWSVDPFSGLVKDGFVWGRGALDMKSMTAIEIMVIKLLKRNSVKLKGNVIFAATADEEKGGEAGAGWLVRNHPEKVRADYVINEGGGFAIPADGGRNIYTIQTSEKGILWLKIKAKGRPGHGSKPGLADNAIMRINKVVDKLGNYRSAILLTSTTKHYLESIAEGNKQLKPYISSILKKPAEADKVLDELSKTDRAVAEDTRTMLRMTIAPTMIHGGIKENIIPSECEAVFDCRILPGKTTAQAVEEIKDLLKDVDLEKLEFEKIQANEPSESPMDTPLYKSIVETLREFEPNCLAAPLMLTGGTDSRFFRALGSVCYGFQPMQADLPYGEILKMVHGIDERISIRNLIFGTSILYNVVEKFMA